MQKKVMALAVAGALSIPAAAFAQASNVQIYGRANLGFDNYKASGATAAGADLKARYRVYDVGSRFGVRGSEDLGNGLKALFVIESGVNIDTGSQANQQGSVNSSTGTFASRDSYAGLEGGWGRLTLGRQSIYWGNGVLAQFSANYINTELPMLTGASWGRIGTNTTRVNNTVAYTTPTMGGFNATVSYAPGAEAVQGNSAGGTDTNGRTWGLTARYSGFVNAQADYLKIKRNQANTGATIPGDVTAWKAGLGWPYAPGAQVAVLYQSIKNADVAAVAGLQAAGDDLKQKSLAVVWEHTFGNIQALAGYGRLGNLTGCTPAGGCDNTKAKAYMVGARYLLSKRTTAYATYNKTTNDSNQNLDYTGSGYTAAAGALPLGADPRVWAVGLMHNF